MSNAYPRLFTPLRVGSTELRNRIIFAVSVHPSAFFPEAPWLRTMP
jgi:2,4-dienoyl-CoA reductase-like NADH-dependent reductase (Old Yellow Enzyme family)